MLLTSQGDTLEGGGEELTWIPTSHRETEHQFQLDQS